MDKLLGDIRHNLTLVVSVGVTSVLGTLLVVKLFSGKPRRSKKSGPGPTGRGKWKLYHTKTFRSSRCTWLIQGMSNIPTVRDLTLIIGGGWVESRSMKIS